MKVKILIFFIALCAHSRDQLAADNDDQEQLKPTIIFPKLSPRRRGSAPNILQLGTDQTRPLSPGRAGLKDLPDRKAKSLPSSPKSLDQMYSTHDSRHDHTQDASLDADIIFFKQSVRDLSATVGSLAKSALQLSLTVKKFTDIKQNIFELDKIDNKLKVTQCDFDKQIRTLYAAQDSLQDTLQNLNMRRKKLNQEAEELKTTMYALIRKGHHTVFKEVSKKLTAYAATKTPPDSK